MKTQLNLTIMLSARDCRPLKAVGIAEVWTAIIADGISERIIRRHGIDAITTIKTVGVELFSIDDYDDINDLLMVGDLTHDDACCMVADYLAAELRQQANAVTGTDIDVNISVDILRACSKD
jgi:hypothetical protein